MSASKMDIFKKLIEGYVKAPPSFQEQAITTLAIHLFQNLELNKYMIYELEPLQYKYISCVEWKKLIEEQSVNMCQKIPLPPVLKTKLIPRLQVIALQVYNWNIQQDMFNLSPLYVSSCLNTSDWIIVEMRLEEKKIAKRLTQDERIPVCQRYRMACFHCLEDIIPSLWNQIPRENLCNDWLLNEDLISVRLWCLHLEGVLDGLRPTEEKFTDDLLSAGVWDGSTSTVLHCWCKSDIHVRQGVLKYTAMRALKLFYRRSGGHDADIFFFLLSQMSKVQRVELFQEILPNSEFNVFILFLQWPYMELLVPIMKELWNILPEAKYEELLLTLANHYSEENFHFVGRKNYLDYEYGFLIIELLDETPDYLKRYVFGNKYQNGMHWKVYFNVVEVDILYIILNRGHHKIHYREIFKHIWKHITLEEKRFFLRSQHGKRLCCNLAAQENWELFISILRECLPEGEIPIFKKAILGMNK